MDTLPLTPNGKVDRKALPAPTLPEQPAVDFLAPETETEKTLARLWSDVLGVERIAANHDFFELGGHSLSAVRLFVRAREAFHLELPLSVIFETPTLADLAQRIDTLRQTSSQPSARASGPRP
ncbi:MAG TPA: phosphopantetheine-binding protein, partial [Anaerolineales bacterium]|nr:phosphopantetheine-binding protein [Anaerolineales bacterium]